MTEEQFNADLAAVFKSHPTAQVVYSTPDGQLFLERRYADAHAGYQKAEQVKKHIRPDAEPQETEPAKPAKAVKAAKAAEPAEEEDDSTTPTE